MAEISSLSNVFVAVDSSWFRLRNMKAAGRLKTGRHNYRIIPSIIHRVINPGIHILCFEFSTKLDTVKMCAYFKGVQSPKSIAKKNGPDFAGGKRSDFHGFMASLPVCTCACPLRRSREVGKVIYLAHDTIGHRQWSWAFSFVHVTEGHRAETFPTGSPECRKRWINNGIKTVGNFNSIGRSRYKFSEVSN